MEQNKPKQGMSWGVKLAFALPVVAVGVLMAVTTWMNNSVDGKAKTEGRAAIVQCWMSLSGKAPRAQAAGTSGCQELEFEFKKRFNENP
ncbi:hypothetical protein [Paracidovorax wautersii]|uniref:Uncharacterized protein n=1 Tax=Paracidovorax wautersii TaxID=1177982 RepID=A0ABU1IG16_9BURK|nr:hypothetical protein [Paracidovorax wautersii]MDR6216165.1 hypothetical protein [Paracidovorax wautersii]